MSTHPAILGEMIQTDAPDVEKTSRDVERDLGQSAGAGGGTGDPTHGPGAPSRNPPRTGLPPDIAPLRKQSE